ncbi:MULTISPECIES: ATP synthase F1 subunit epsilon [unclassified Saccharicrinis]|uniref:ATP synthase F1 subunit epsilon n=1 Tax=unclassified Saccharicrinis TaxID=2646859 RepID=UPI003D34B674
MNDLKLQIITPEKILFSADVGFIQLPGIDGSFTVLKNHAPIVSTLTSGKIRVFSKDGKEHFFNCDGGVFECKNNNATVLIGSIKK